jgi:hypothetical protein
VSISVKTLHAIFSLSATIPLLCFRRPFSNTTVPAKFMIEEDTNTKVTQGAVR